jgi:para-nitrobenzyl esterase
MGVLACTTLAQTVTLPDGGPVLTGAYCDSSNTTRCFKGIPFAQAPVGDLRFAPPEPYTFSKSTYDATKAGPTCVGNSGGQEDCLYLDVYAPPDGTQAKAVMVWIHGGCYVNGSAKGYDGTALAASGDVVVVII